MELPKVGQIWQCSDQQHIVRIAEVLTKTFTVQDQAYGADHWEEQRQTYKIEDYLDGVWRCTDKGLDADERAWYHLVRVVYEPPSRS